MWRGRSKKLWLDGFGKLSSVLTVKEMSDLQEVMRDKELNIRTDIYEILLLQGWYVWIVLCLCLFLFFFFFEIWLKCRRRKRKKIDDLNSQVLQMLESFKIIDSVLLFNNLQFCPFPCYLLLFTRNEERDIYQFAIFCM